MIKRLAYAILFAATIAFAPLADAQILLPNAEQVFLDSNGAPLAGGKVYTYIPNTTTPKTTWLDSGLSTPNTNPITLDAAGRAIIWGSGLYRQVVKDALGNQIWDRTAGSATSAIGPTPDPIGNNVALWNGGLNLKDGGSSTGKIGALALAGATSGTVTLAAPAVAGANTITFPAATLDLADLSQGNVGTTIPYAVLPVYARLLIAKTYDNTFNSYVNLFQSASFAKGQTTAAVVAQFGQGESALSGNTSWGGNHVGVASVTGAVAIAEELDAVVTAAGGKAYGLVVAAAGGFPTGAPAVQIQTNTAAATFGTGINFNNALFNAVTGALIQADSNTVAQNGINFAGSYTVGEIATPSFGVGATPVGLNAKVLISGSSSGNPSISAAGASATPATDANLILNPLGTGEVQVNGVFAVTTALRPKPVAAPGNPASGWYLYTDSGDANKLKAKASTGTVVTLGTP